MYVRKLSKKRQKYNFWKDDSVVYTRGNAYVDGANGEMVELSNYPSYQQPQSRRENNVSVELIF
jgi:hypothetical protein